MSGYQRLKMTLSSPFSVCTRVCNNKCAPSLDHYICCFLQNRLLTASFTVDSTNPVAIASPWRYGSVTDSCAITPTATLLEHALLVQGFMGAQKAAFPRCLRPPDSIGFSGGLMGFRW